MACQWRSSISQWRSGIRVAITSLLLRPMAMSMCSMSALQRCRSSFQIHSVQSAVCCYSWKLFLVVLIIAADGMQLVQQSLSFGTVISI